MLPLITNVHLTLTHRCNLACRYCFVKQEPLDMTLKVAKDAIDFIAKNARASNQNPRVCFFGGEPLLMWDSIMVPLVEYIETTYSDLTFGITTTTNGVLLTEDKITFMKQHHMGLLTSIDGAACTQNHNRPLHNGGESFPVIEPNLKKALHAGYRPTFRSTIIPATCGEMYNNYLYAIGLGFNSMFMITDAYSTWDEAAKETVRGEMYKIADHYIKYWIEKKTFPMRMSFLEKYFAAWTRDRACEIHKTNPPGNRCTAQRKCGLGQNASAAVSPAGDLYACQELTSNEGPESVFYIGNIYTGADDGLRQRLSDLYDNAKIQGSENCASCPVSRLCNHGCVANNYMITGHVNLASDGFCFFNKLVYEVSGYAIKELKGSRVFMSFLMNKAQRKPARPRKPSELTPQSML